MEFEYIWCRVYARVLLGDIWQAKTESRRIRLYDVDVREVRVEVKARTRAMKLSCPRQ